MSFSAYKEYVYHTGGIDMHTHSKNGRYGEFNKKNADHIKNGTGTSVHVAIALALVLLVIGAYNNWPALVELYTQFVG